MLESGSGEEWSYTCLPAIKTSLKLLRRLLLVIHVRDPSQGGAISSLPRLGSMCSSPFRDSGMGQCKLHCGDCLSLTVYDITWISSKVPGCYGLC
jgi:hypothetical protein